MDQDNVLIMEHISKSFPGVKALNDVQLTVRRGSVHALMGENGAGKSTLMKVLIGMYIPEEGEITFQGKKIKIENTQQALRMGISMIHQELSPEPYMTVAENVYLGREPLGRLKLIDKKNWLPPSNSMPLPSFAQDRRGMRCGGEPLPSGSDRPCRRTSCPAQPIIIG